MRRAAVVLAALAAILAAGCVPDAVQYRGPRECVFEVDGVKVGMACP